MVPGIDKFREHFAGHEENYALIGGAACSLIFEEVGVDYRATRDIDMVLCVEVVDIAFGKALKDFLDAGQYQARERGEKRREFYRFHQPQDKNYPEMLELFSSPDAAVDLGSDDELATIAVSDDMLSLSAILLEKDYYQALVDSRRTIDGIHVLDETLLIPFKARAFVDLTRRRDEGEKVKGSDIKKHRNDVFRLLQLLTPTSTIEVSEPLKKDLRAYIAHLAEDGTFKPKDFDVAIERDEGHELLNKIYQL
ncbi:hypothetical protein [Yoonia sp. R2-816]|uniref:hypothetical protein n=1 Tax=Yoonia sp. R2-816 TaxID=3342638 RepID=UPI003728F00D